MRAGVRGDYTANREGGGKAHHRGGGGARLYIDRFRTFASVAGAARILQSMDWRGACGRDGMAGAGPGTADRSTGNRPATAFGGEPGISVHPAAAARAGLARGAARTYRGVCDRAGLS